MNLQLSGNNNYKIKKYFYFYLGGFSTYGLQPRRTCSSYKEKIIFVQKGSAEIITKRVPFLEDEEGLDPRMKKFLRCFSYGRNQKTL